MPCRDFEPKFPQYADFKDWTNFDDFWKVYKKAWLPYENENILLGFVIGNDFSTVYRIRLQDFLDGTMTENNKLKSVEKIFYKRDKISRGVQLYKIVHEKTPGGVSLKNLNESKGTTINELEAFLIVCEKLLEDKVKAGEKGIIIAKGKPNQIKISYKRALKILGSLRALFGLRGCFSFGICKTCTQFDSSQSGTKDFGNCQGKRVHKYDSCSNHSKQGGGFGL
jgi:hypothetical protein